MQPAGRKTNLLRGKCVGFCAAFSILMGYPGSRHGGNMGHRRSWSRWSLWVRAGAAVLGMLLCGCWCPLVSPHHGVLPWLMPPPAPCFSLPLPHVSPTPGCRYMAHGVFSCPDTLKSTSGTPHHTPSSCSCPLPGHCGIVCHEFSLTLEIFFEFPQWTRREKAKINHIPVGVPHRVPTNRLTMQQLLGFHTCFP